MKTLLELLTERTAIEKAISDARRTQRKAAIVEIRKLLKLYDIQVSDLSILDPVDVSDFRKSNQDKSDLKSKLSKKPKRSKKVSVKLTPKYEDGAGNTWTGRGKSPRWLVTAESTGRMRNEFLISK
jgi:DNA-binding protein H-NS